MISSVRRWVPVAVSAVLLLVAFVPHASAPQSRWGTPVLIESAAGSAELPQVAADPFGNAMAVWDQFGATYKSIWASRFDNVSGWGTPVLLETNETGDAYAAQIDLSESGYAVAVWHQLDGSRSDVWANVYSPGGGWGTATLLETNDTYSAWEPQVAIDASGNAIAVWYCGGTTVSNVWSSYYQAGVGWSPPVLVEFDDTGDAFEPQVGMDALGNAIALWVYDDGAMYSLGSNTFVPGAGWGTPVSVEADSTGNVVTPHLAVSAAGKAVAVWTWDDWSWMDVWANTYEPGSGWGTEVLLETENRGWAFDVEVGIDPTGVAIAAWSQNTAVPAYNLFASRFVPGSGWGSPTLLETDDTWDALYPQVAFDASGAATVVWEQYVGGLWQDIFANRYDPITGWQGAVLVAQALTGSAQDPQLAADPSGNVTVVWAQFDGPASSIWSNRYLSPTMGALPPAAPGGVTATLLGGGQDVLVTWQASPDESDPSAFDHYEVLRGQVYDASGAGYSLVAASLPAGTTSFLDTSTVPGASLFYIVRAVGPGGATDADEQAAKFVRDLPPGRSLLGLPVSLQDNAVLSVLDSIRPVLEFVSAYDPADPVDPWRTWVAAKSGGDLSSLSPSVGFWVSLSSGAEWRVAGSVATFKAVPLLPGWNLVPSPSMSPRVASTTLLGLPVTELEGFNGSAAPYYLEALPWDAILRAGEGYWLFATAPAIWTSPS